jgi:hypothetical protein
MRLQTVLITSSLSLSLLCAAPAAQSGCCPAGPQAGVAAQNLVKDLAGAVAKLRALPDDEKTAAVASLKGAAEACPVGRASLQVVNVLKLAADALDESGCCAGAKDEAGKAGVARVDDLRTVLAAHVALLDEIGLPRLAPDCCVKDEGAKTGAAAECEGVKETKSCCEAGGVAKFVACAASIEKTCNEIPAKVAALDPKAKEKSAAGAATLGKLGLGPVMFAALGFYADGLGAAAKDCGDAPEGAVVKGLAAMTSAFVKNAGGAGAGCCSEKTEKAGADCCTEKAEKTGAACCVEKLEKKESGCCSEKAGTTGEKKADLK